MQNPNEFAEHLRDLGAALRERNAIPEAICAAFQAEITKRDTEFREEISRRAKRAITETLEVRLWY